MKVYLHKKLIDEYEKKGLVADSHEIRIALLEKCKAYEMTLEEMRAILKKLQKEAHGKGMYIVKDFWNDNGVDLEPAIEKQKLKDVKKLYKKISKVVPNKILVREVSRKKI